MWAAAAPVAITDEQREVLKRWVRAQRTPQSLVLRARIVLLAADGHTNQAIARVLGTTRNTVLHWRTGTVSLQCGAPRTGALSLIH